MPDPTPELATDYEVDGIETFVDMAHIPEGRNDTVALIHNTHHRIKQLIARIRADALKLSRQQEEIGRLKSDLRGQEFYASKLLLVCDQLRGNSLSLPDIELISAEVHRVWMQEKTSAGVHSRKSESGEEMMVPYEQLSKKCKDMDRATVRAVYNAISVAALSPPPMKEQ